METSGNRDLLKSIIATYRIIVVLVVSSIISFLLTQGRGGAYEFEEGAKWKYSDLRAPEDFAIRKPETQINKERNQIAEGFTPYYTLKNTPKEDLVANIRENYELFLSKTEGDTATFLNQYATQNIDLLFDLVQEAQGKGIININSKHRSKGSGFLINIEDNGSIITKPIIDVPDQTTVINQISNYLIDLKRQDLTYLIPLLGSIVTPNLEFDENLTKEFLDQAFNNISPNIGMVEQGELIITHNATINKDTYQKLASLNSKYQSDNRNQLRSIRTLLGYFILISGILTLYLLYIRTYIRDVFMFSRKMLFMNMWFLLYAVLMFLVSRSERLDILVIPFSIAPIIIKNFYNQRLAFFTHIIIMLIVAQYGAVSKDFLVMNIVAGIVVIILTKETRYWSKFFVLLMLLLAAYVGIYVLQVFIRNYSLVEFSWGSIGWLCLNVFLTLLAYPLIPLLEKIFGFTSNITLSELSDLNNPLLKELSIKAPGTFQHSLHVSSLAEAAAEKIGANLTLAKVGSLYHDIGKSKHSLYFTENQSGENPHDHLEYEESAKIIIEHVPEGVKMAKKQGLPNVVIEFIKSHHGTTKVEYFFRKFLEEHPDQIIDEKVFTYPGPKPRTKEQCIVMMADSLEAATKSLKNPTEEDIELLVDNMIKYKINEGQFDHADITFEDIYQCKKVFKTMLINMNHSRIAYPEKPK